MRTVPCGRGVVIRTKRLDTCLAVCRPHPTVTKESTVHSPIVLCNILPLGTEDVICNGRYLYMQRKKSNTLFKVSITSVAVAMSIVVCRYLGFSPQDSIVRFDLGILPLAIIADLFGPIYSGVGYLAADVLGQLIQGFAPNPWISACKLLSGVMMGLGFSRGRTSLLRITLTFTFINVFIDFLAMSPVFALVFGYTWGTAFLTRAINALITLPIRIILFYILTKSLKKPLARFRRYNMKAQNKFKAYANSFQAVTVPGLERIKALCEKLGSPEKNMKFIHVAGTNGKGSVCASLAEILRHSGFKVGKYISPNLLRVNERISINGIDISDAELSDLLVRIEPLVKEIEEKTSVAPTQFEIWTAAAFLYFNEKKCDYVVLEVGLGGELDATNVIEQNELAIITRLGLDHTQYLGSTIGEVAAAKAGIIKRKCNTGAVVTTNQVPEAMKVLEEKAESLGCRLHVGEYTNRGSEGIYEIFDSSGIEGLRCGIAGLHQTENAALAVKAAQLLGIEEKHIRAGILAARNPARFELIRENPTVIYDGGHNENGIEALIASLKKYFGNVEKTVVFACMKDKEIDRSLKMLGEDTHFAFTTVKDNPRAMSASELQAYALSRGFLGEAFDTVGEAYEWALKEGRLTVICGSLYLYGDFKEYLDKKEIK